MGSETARWDCRVRFAQPDNSQLAPRGPWLPLPAELGRGRTRSGAMQGLSKGIKHRASERGGGTSEGAVREMQFRGLMHVCGGFLGRFLLFVFFFGGRVRLCRAIFV